MDRPEQLDTQAKNRSINWWICPPDGPARVEVVGVNPEGEPLWMYPEALTLPTEIWVTRWGFTIDDWKFLGWPLWSTGNLDRFGRWRSAWSRESDTIRRVLNDFLDEKEWQAKYLLESGTVFEARAFLSRPRTDLDLSLHKVGWVQE